MPWQHEAVDDAAPGRFDRIPPERVAARAHGPRRMAERRALRAPLDHELVVLQGVPEELRVGGRGRSQAIAHFSSFSRSGLNLRMRNVWRPTTSPFSSRYVVTHVTK